MSTTPVIGTKVAAIGFPGVTNRKSFRYTKDLIQLDVDAVPGSSGGPIIDLSKGQIGGIFQRGYENWKTEHCEGATFATSIETIKKHMTGFPKAANVDEIFNCNMNAAIK